MSFYKYKVSWLCEYAISIHFEDVFSPELTKHLCHLENSIRLMKPVGLQETVITYQSVTLFFEPLEVHEKLKTSPFEYYSAILNKASRIDTGWVQKNSELYKIPVKYGSDDLSLLSNLLALKEQEIIELHQSVEYTVYMVGFLPGFPYMGGLPKALHVPRKIKPSLSVKKGSVAVAGRQTGIYSQDSPGGWYVLGSCDIELFDPGRVPMSRFKVGDRVRFTSL